MITNFYAAKQFVQNARESQVHESISGPGSSIANTVEVRDLIQEVITNYNIKSILDLGCGDWNWFKLINLSGVIYEGWDSDTDMISLNQSNYGNDNIRFKTYDIVLSDYPEVDLIICRDVLFHLPIHLANKIIKKSLHSCKYFISTCFRDIDKNKGLKPSEDWGYYPINLNIDPFNLSSYENKFQREMLGASPNGIILSPQRYISLYDFTKFEKMNS